MFDFGFTNIMNASFFLQYQVSVFLNYQVGKFTLPIFGNFILRNFGGTKLLITIEKKMQLLQIKVLKSSNYFTFFGLYGETARFLIMYIAIVTCNHLARHQSVS